MLPSNLWENQTSVARMSFKYISLSAGDNDPVCPSASEQHNHTTTQKHTHKHINALMPEAFLRATSGQLKSRKQSPGKKMSHSQESVLLFYWKSIKQRDESFKEDSDLIGCQCSQGYADDQGEDVLLINAG